MEIKNNQIKNFITFFRSKFPNLLSIDDFKIVKKDKFYSLYFPNISTEIMRICNDGKIIFVKDSSKNKNMLAIKKTDLKLEANANYNNIIHRILNFNGLSIVTNEKLKNKTLTQLGSIIKNYIDKKRKKLHQQLGDDKTVILYDGFTDENNLPNGKGIFKPGDGLIYDGIFKEGFLVEGNIFSNDFIYVRTEGSIKDEDVQEMNKQQLEQQKNCVNDLIMTATKNNKNSTTTYQYILDNNEKLSMVINNKTGYLQDIKYQKNKNENYRITYNSTILHNIKNNSSQKTHYYHNSQSISNLDEKHNIKKLINNFKCRYFKKIYDTYVNKYKNLLDIKYPNDNYNDLDSKNDKKNKPLLMPPLTFLHEVLNKNYNYKCGVYTIDYNNKDDNRYMRFRKKLVNRIRESLKLMKQNNKKEFFSNIATMNVFNNIPEYNHLEGGHNVILHIDKENKKIILINNITGSDKQTINCVLFKDDPKQQNALKDQILKNNNFFKKEELTLTQEFSYIVDLEKYQCYDEQTGETCTNSAYILASVNAMRNKIINLRNKKQNYLNLASKYDNKKILELDKKINLLKDMIKEMSNTNKLVTLIYCE